MNAPKRTVLFGLHHRLGARMTVFGGFEMPLSYGGIIEEHLAVRAHAGIFDLSHMGQFEVRGEQALELLERALTNSAARLRDGEAQYSLMCAEDGGTVDDLIVYRLAAAHYMLCVNAVNVETDLAWLRAPNVHGASLRDLTGERGIVAVQGPASAAILAPLADFAIGAVARLHAVEGRVAGVRCLAARTGYTGEDGFELFVAAESAAALFEAILDAGAPTGLKPCGLGARDTLRLEAGLPLYGHELDRATSPLEAGLGTFIKFGRSFVGEAALAAQRGGGVRKRLVGLMTDDAKSIARQGYRIFLDGREAGIVTSGTFAPTLNRPIAMGYLSCGEPAPRAGAPTGALEVEIRNRKVPATIVARPFYRRGRQASA
ncbi:MAG TPA: glycine cleavage system aminomethyltransferase GcvT [Candidatus Binataceae bacterium]|nr:glycine cleavage system aminomethyltransferase GcvT [Candidatus Binataceae bacterium]